MPTRRFASLLLFPLLACSSGCYALSDPLRSDSREGPFPYTHVRGTAMALAARVDPELPTPRSARVLRDFDVILALAVAEMPFSFVVDTVLLPYTSIRAIKSAVPRLAACAPENAPR